MEEIQKRIETYKNHLSNDAIRYLFLLKLNPMNGFKTIEEYQESLETFKFIKEHINEMDLKIKVRKEVMKYVNKGITLMYRGIHDLES